MTTLQSRLATKLGGSGSIFRRREGHRESGKFNGTDGFFGAIITGFDETNAYDYDLCSYNENPDGIMESLANDATALNNYDAQGIASYSPNNVNFNIVNPRRNDEFLVCLGSGRGCTRKQLAIIDDQNPGFVEAVNPADESIAQIPPFRIIGEFMETITAVSGQAAYVWVKKRT